MILACLAHPNRCVMGFEAMGYQLYDLGTLLFTIDKSLCHRISEQQGNTRAKYGTAMLSNLAKLLRTKVGRGYSHPNLNNMRKFYLMYPSFQISDKSAPIFQMSEKLTWSHICELVTIDDQLEREFYERECISEGWTVNVHVTGTEVSDILMIGVARWQKSIILLTLRLSLILSSITSVIMKQLSPSALNVVTGMSMISIPQMMVRMTRLISAVSYRNMTPKTVDIKKNRNY